MKEPDTDAIANISVYRGLRAMYRIVENIYTEGIITKNIFWIQLAFIVVPVRDFRVSVLIVCFIFVCLMLAFSLEAPNKQNKKYNHNNPI